ncbi:MAG: acetate/propionate family kinase [Terriglobales bacterium]
MEGISVEEGRSAPMSEGSILVINTGSSSLKFGLYAEQDGEEQLLLDGLADGIGRSSGKLELRDAHGRVLRSENLSFTSQGDALDRAAQWLTELSRSQPYAIGHRVVHGGPHLVTHQRITPAVLGELQTCLHFAPLHIPLALQLIDRAERFYPKVPQFACFDTAFHNTIPEAAARFALPRGLFDEGIRRYGFHGLSYESIVHQLGHGLPSRTIIAHLGSGASLAAVKDGRSVDTTMGLTPTGGIPMATRSGDLDPGVLLYLLRVKQMNADSLEELLNHNSGLMALSGGDGDMRDLEAAADGADREAQLAIGVFGTSIRKVIAAYTAVLGGLDLLVFAGGIGEHSARLRSDVCHGLHFLGISIDDSANRLHGSRISTTHSNVRVEVVASQEDRQIARHSRALMRKNGAAGAP